MSVKIPLLFGLIGVLACATASREQPIDPTIDATSIDSPTIEDDAAVVGPDANTCATQPCDILTQCGCGAMACDIDSSDNMGTACRTIFTPGHETNTCANPTRCDKGFVCLGGGGGGTCKKYCGTNADCGAPRGQCVIDINSGGTPLVGIPSVCSSNCDPTNTAAGGCPGGHKCGLFTQTHQAMTFNIADCSAAGSGVQAANCKVGAAGDDTLCAADFLCTTVNAGTNFNCRRICNRTLNTGCGALTCIGFNPANTIGGTEYGVCN